MEPYLFINRASELLKTSQSRETLQELPDELEYLYEALNPEFQDLAAQLIEVSVRIPNKENIGAMQRISGFAAHKYLANILTTDFHQSIIGHWVSRHANGSGSIIGQVAECTDHDVLMEASESPKHCWRQRSSRLINNKHCRTTFNGKHPFCLFCNISMIRLAGNGKSMHLNNHGLRTAFTRLPRKSSIKN
jgi:hypothetical protein